MVTATRRRRRATVATKPAAAATEEKKLLKPSQVGTRLNIGKTQVYALMNSGRLAYVDCGERCRRVEPEVLEKFIADQTVTAS